MSFRPNMTKEEMWAEDMHRGRRSAPKTPPSLSAPPYKAYSSKAMNEDEVVDEIDREDEEMDTDMEKALTGLSSFVQKAATYPEEGEDFGKPLPEKKKREGESEFGRKIRQWSEEVKERPGRFPGGQKQAVAIAAEQAGVAKKGTMGVPSTSSPPAAGSAAATMGSPAAGTGIAKSNLDEFKEYMTAKTEKALSTRSMYVPPPREKYDPFNIHRSTSTVTTRNHSALRGREGVAPLVGETFANLFEDDKNKRNPNTEMAYKSCMVHGISYRADRSCHPCSIAKSTMCKCGTQMVKSPGGSYRCPTCG